MWGYPEFYIPVPGGYGAEASQRVGVSHAVAVTPPGVTPPGESAPSPA